MNNNREMLLNFNSFLTEIYGKEQRISTILAEKGFSKQHLDTLKGDKLTELFALIEFAIKCRFIGQVVFRAIDVIIRRYGLFGRRKETLQAIGDSMGISRERVRQLQEKALKRLTPGTNHDVLSDIIVLSVCHVMQLKPDSFIDEESKN